MSKPCPRALSVQNKQNKKDLSGWVMVWGTSVCVVGKILVGKNCRIGARNRRTWIQFSHNILSLGGLEIGSFSLVAWAAGRVPGSALTRSRGCEDGRTKGLVWPLFHARLPSLGSVQRHEPPAGGWQEGTNMLYDSTSGCSAVIVTVTTTAFGI